MTIKHFRMSWFNSRHTFYACWLSTFYTFYHYVGFYRKSKNKKINETIYPNAKEKNVDNYISIKDSLWRASAYELTCSLSGCYGNRNYFFIEIPSILCGLTLLLRTKCKKVLFFSGYTVFLCHIFSF